MNSDSPHYLREVQYRFPDRLQARSLLHTRYGRNDWFEWLSDNIPLPADSVVADVGCGAGAFWTNAPRSVPDNLKLRLFDQSAGMVEAAIRAVQTSDRWTDVKGQVADAADIPIATGTVDSVLAIHMLYHLDDPEAGAREFARILRPTGVAAIVLNPSGTMKELTSLVDAALDRKPGKRSEPLTSDQAKPMLERAFRTVECIRFNDQLVVTDPVDLIAYLLSLPIAESEQAQRAIAEKVSAIFAGPHQSFRITKAADLLLCRK